MPTYQVTDPKTGRKVKLTGDRPPTVADLEQIFRGGAVAGGGTAAAASPAPAPSLPSGPPSTAAQPPAVAPAPAAAGHGASGSWDTPARPGRTAADLTAAMSDLRIPLSPPKTSGMARGILESVAGVPAEAPLSDIIEGPAYAAKHPVDSANLMMDAHNADARDTNESLGLNAITRIAAKLFGASPEDTERGLQQMAEGTGQNPLIMAPAGIIKSIGAGIGEATSEAARDDPEVAERGTGRTIGVPLSLLPFGEGGLRFRNWEGGRTGAPHQNLAKSMNQAPAGVNLREMFADRFTPKREEQRGAVVPAAIDPKSTSIPPIANEPLHNSNIAERQAAVTPEAEKAIHSRGRLHEAQRKLALPDLDPESRKLLQETVADETEFLKDKGGADLYAGFDPRKIFQKDKGKKTEPVVDLSKRNFLKKAPAAAGAVAMGGPEAAAKAVELSSSAKDYIGSVEHVTTELERMVSEGMSDDQLADYFSDLRPITRGLLEGEISPAEVGIPDEAIAHILERSEGVFKAAELNGYVDYANSLLKRNYGSVNDIQTMEHVARSLRERNRGDLAAQLDAKAANIKAESAEAVRKGADFDREVDSTMSRLSNEAEAAERKKALEGPRTPDPSSETVAQQDARLKAQRERDAGTARFPSKAMAGFDPRDLLEGFDGLRVRKLGPNNNTRFGFPGEERTREAALVGEGKTSERSELTDRAANSVGTQRVVIENDKGQAVAAMSYVLDKGVITANLFGSNTPGLGMRLAKGAMDRARKLQWPVIIEDAVTRARPMYERLGFKYSDIDGNPVPKPEPGAMHVSMVWEPDGKKKSLAGAGADPRDLFQMASKEEFDSMAEKSDRAGMYEFYTEHDKDAVRRTEDVPVSKIKALHSTEERKRIGGPYDKSKAPSVQLRKVGDDYYIMDGHHRINRQLQEGAKTIRATVTDIDATVSRDRSSNPRVRQLQRTLDYLSEKHAESLAIVQADGKVFSNKPKGGGQFFWSKAGFDPRELLEGFEPGSRIVRLGPESKYKGKPAPEDKPYWNTDDYNKHSYTNIAAEGMGTQRIVIQDKDGHAVAAMAFSRQGRVPGGSITVMMFGSTVPGLGTKMLKALKDRGQRLGKSVWLEMPSEKAIPLYERMGFEMMDKDQTYMAWFPKDTTTEAKAGVNPTSLFDFGRYDEGKGETVPLTRSERTGSRTSGIFEKTIESSIPGAGPFQRFREKQQAALGRMANRTVDAMSRYRGTAEQAGKHAQTDIANFKSGEEAKFTQRYKDLDARAQGVRPKTALLKSFATDALSKMEQESVLIPPVEMERARKILESLRDSPKAVDFSVMQDARSTLLSISRQMTTDGKTKGAIKKITGLIETAMEDAAKVDPGLHKEFRNLSRDYANFMQTYRKGGAVSKIVKGAAEKAHEQLRTASLDDTRRLQQTLRPATMKALKARMVRELLNKATDGELTDRTSVLSKMKGTVAKPIVRLHGGKFRKMLEGQYGKQKLEVIFSKKELESMYSLMDIAEKTDSNNQGNYLAAILNASLIGGTLATPLSPATGLKTGAAAVSLNVLARVMTRSWEAAAMKKYMRSEPSTAQKAFWGARLREAVTRAQREEAEESAEE